MRWAVIETRIGLTLVSEINGGFESAKEECSNVMRTVIQGIESLKDSYYTPIDLPMHRPTVAAMTPQWSGTQHKKCICKRTVHIIIHTEVIVASPESHVFPSDQVHFMLNPC